MVLRFFIVLLLVASCVPAEVKVIEQIVAKVNGDIITRGEIERSHQTVEMELKQQKVSADKFDELLKEKEKDALKDQIDSLLLVQKAKELNINVDPDVTRELAEIQKNSGISDPDKFHEWIHEQAGVPFEDVKQQMKNRYMTQRVIRQEIGGKIIIPTPELLKYYEAHKSEFVRQEQVFLREILVSTVSKTPAQAAAAEKRAKDILARARKGEKFPELARETSESETAKEYGEIGWFKRGALNPQLEELVFKQKKGYVTDIIKVDNGFLIIKLEERHEPGQAPFEEVENDIMEKLYMPRMQPKIKDYLTKLREDAFLEIRAGYVDSGAAPGKDTTWRDPAQLKPETTTKEEVAARKRKRLLGVIPRKSAKTGGEAPAVPPPTVTPVPPPPSQVPRP